MKICDLFTSLQGEGRSQGYPCTFVRLAGCNLSCSWCDTRYSRDHPGTDTTAEAITGFVTSKGIRRVCITGGEPLLQTGSLVPLLADLHERGCLIEIETNGTMPVAPVQPYATVCMDIKCPSSGMKSDLALLHDIRGSDSVKFVVSGGEDLDFARGIIEGHDIRGEVFISPVYGSDYRAISSYVLENLPGARFQLQLHKLLGVP